MEQLKTEKLPAKLTEEEIEFYENKCAELARAKNVSKVHSVVMIDADNDNVRRVCYLTEPNYTTKIRVMDKATTLGVYTAADELREAITIRESSDPMTYGDGHESDKFKIGVCDECLKMVERMKNMFKKK